MRVPSPQPWQKIETNQGITSVAEVLNGKGAPLLDDDSLMREFSEVLDKIAVKLSGLGELGVEGELSAPIATTANIKPKQQDKSKPEASKPGDSSDQRAPEAYDADVFVAKQVNVKPAKSAEPPPVKVKAQPETAVEERAEPVELIVVKEQPRGAEYFSDIELGEQAVDQVVEQVAEQVVEQVVEQADGEVLGLAAVGLTQDADLSARLQGELSQTEEPVVSEENQSENPFDQQALGPEIVDPEIESEAAPETVSQDVKAEAPILEFTETSDQILVPENAETELRTAEDLVSKFNPAALEKALGEADLMPKGSELVEKLIAAMRERIGSEDALRNELASLNNSAKLALTGQAPAEGIRLVLEKMVPEIVSAPHLLRQMMEALVAKPLSTVSSVQSAAANLPGFGRPADASQADASKLKSRSMPASQSARTLAKVEAAIREVATSKDGKSISVRLDPPSLGTVKVDIRIKDGGLHARLVAENPAVNQLLRERSQEIQSLLRRLNLNVDKVSVSVNSEGGEKEGFNVGQHHESFAGLFSDSSGRKQGQFGQRSHAFSQEGQGFSGAATAKNVVYDHWVA